MYIKNIFIYIIYLIYLYDNIIYLYDMRKRERLK